VSVIGHYHIEDFVNATSFIQGPIHVVDQDQLRELAGQQFCPLYEVLVNEISSGAGIDSTMASVAASSRVSVVFRWIASMMQLGPSSSEWMMSFQLSHHSHFGQCGL